MLQFHDDNIRLDRVLPVTGTVWASADVDIDETDVRAVDSLGREKQR
jgi:hypothetical protein